MILVVDNYDSFTYNLVNLVKIHDQEVQVIKNDSHSLEDIEGLDPKAIIISPGPGRPEDAGICLDLVKKFSPHCPILGICLGHQVIGQAFGGQVVLAHEGLFDHMPQGFEATRYHSLVVSPDKLPPSLCVHAWSAKDNHIMAIKHKDYPSYGLQFHPESYKTPEGIGLIKNFIRTIEKGDDHVSKTL